MTRYVLSPRAQADVEDVWNYTAENWGERQAERYVRELQRAIGPWRPTRAKVDLATTFAGVTAAVRSDLT